MSCLEDKITKSFHSHTTQILNNQHTILFGSRFKPLNISPLQIRNVQNSENSLALYSLLQTE
jgi:hypothetical protein